MSFVRLLPRKARRPLENCVVFVIANVPIGLHANSHGVAGFTSSTVNAQARRSRLFRRPRLITIVTESG